MGSDPKPRGAMDQDHDLAQTLPLPGDIEEASSNGDSLQKSLEAIMDKSSWDDHGPIVLPVPSGNSASSVYFALHRCLLVCL